MTDCPCTNCPCVAICRLKYYVNIITRCELVRKYVVDEPDSRVSSCRIAIMRALNPTEWEINSEGVVVYDRH